MEISPKIHFKIRIKLFVEIRTSEKSQCGSEMKITGQANGLKMDNKGETAPVYDGFNSIIPTDSNYSNININTTLDIPIENLEIVITEKRKNDNEGFRKEYAVQLNFLILLE